MNRISRPTRILCCAMALAMAVCAAASAADTNPSETNLAKTFDQQLKPSLVVIKYTYNSELNSQELTAAGVVVSKDGLVMMPMGLLSPAIIADGQTKDFKIVIPSDTEDPTELDATLLLRDQRSDVVFVKADAPRKWTPVKFVDVLPEVGTTVYSVGLLPKGAGYKTIVTRAMVSAYLRGAVPQVLVDGRLAGVGGVVLDEKGQAIGYIHPRSLEESLLDNPRNPDDLPQVNSPPRMFIPSYDFLPSLEHPPTSDKPQALPWLGCVELKGLEPEVAEYYHLKNVPAIQIGDVVPNSPADKAGLKVSDIIVKMDGKPLERGDLPQELPQILTRKIQRLNPGDKVVLSVVREQGSGKPQDVTVTLEPRPREPYEANRFYARDLGFVVRDVVFADTYRRKISAGTQGVVVALLRPQASAQEAKLEPNDLITQMNGKPVTSLEEFKKDYTQFRQDKPNDAVVLEVLQMDGKEETINIEPPQSSGNDMEP